MAVEIAVPQLTAAQREGFERDGYTVYPGLCTPEEVQGLADAHAALHTRGEIQGCFKSVPPAQATDPLAAFPRIMHPHRVGPVARRYLIHLKLEPLLGALFGEAPLSGSLRES